LHVKSIGEFENPEGQRVEVVVIGGSLGGLTAALVLRDQGHNVRVLERSPTPLEGQGAGIIGHPATIRYLTERKGLPTNRIGLPARWLRYLGDAGEVLSSAPANLRLLSYSFLYSELRAALDPGSYILGAEVVGFEQHNDKVEVQITGGRELQADLLVCADGVRSGARSRLAPSAQPNYAGYVAWRGVAPPRALSDRSQSVLAEAITYKIMPHSHMLTYPIPVPQDAPDNFVFNWLWYRNVDRERLTNLLVDSGGKRNDISVAAGRVRDEFVDELRKDAEENLPPVLAQLVHASDDPFIQVIADVEASRMAFGRVCVLGDAAFALRPHVATGTAKAAEDAWQLAYALEGAESHDVPRRLLQWEQRQLALGRSLLARARYAGRMVQFDNSWRIGMELPFGLYRFGDSELPVV
jgi:2,6-dihydroxypyridine 3-monooxygenase